MTRIAVRRACVLVLALGIDRWSRELPTPLHPVGVIGRAARLLERRAPTSPQGRLRYGIVAPGLVHAGAALAGLAMGRAAAGQPTALGVALEAGALSTTISLHALLERAAEVEQLLEAGDLEAARASVGRHLVSRDTSSLGAGDVAGATIESVAENLSDGVLAPMLAYALGGLAAAFAYRSINTFDSLWGYRTPTYLELGRHSARLDDAVNLLPSRLTAAALVGATLVRRGPREARRAFDAWVDQGDFTPSPNAGQAMGTMAGALGVELAKDGAYRLGEGWPAPAPTDIRAARQLALTAALAGLGALIAGLGARAVTGARA
ncbi:MAG: cobalamin biosynthesis protein CobD [Dehalococcoidia bacterium]|nr:cobalamin biosynthesis protein CobD [Dehalococcoidia bacterium]